MPLDWSSFRRLDGAPWRNFELVCHQVVRRTWGSYGVLSYPERQRGMEFHLLLHDDCELGRAGQRIGWQCKWYDESLLQLGDSRRAKIRAGIKKSAESFDDLAKWIVWTRNALSEADDRWLQKQQATDLVLESWSEADLEGRLEGSATALRESYFGELVLSEQRLRKDYETALAAIGEKYISGLHVDTAAEDAMRECLGDTSAVVRLRCTLEALAARTEDAGRLLAALDMERSSGSVVDDSVIDGLKVASLKFEPSLAAAHAQASEVAERLETGSFKAARSPADSLKTTLSDEVLTQLNTSMVEADPRDGGLYVPGNAARALDELWELLDELHGLGAEIERIDDGISLSFVAAVGGAGAGKTHFAARLAGGFGVGATGILLHGRELPADLHIDHLADAAGLRGRTFLELLEAVEAAGQRTGRRIPVVIDAINEHRDPRRWEPVLARAKALVADFSHAVVIVTLRPSYAELLPQETAVIRIRGLGRATEEAVARYFEHYKIDAELSLGSVESFSHPLMLRTFCDATNRERTQTVRVEIGAVDLQGTLQAYVDSLEQIAQRELGIDSHARPVRSRLVALASELWRVGERSLPWPRAKELLGDHPEAWDRTLGKLLEEEGVVHRDLLMGGPSGEEHLFISFDRVAGLVIAEALAFASPEDPGAVSRDSDVVTRLVGDPQQRHPLADDVLDALVALLPARTGRQLWQLADDETLRHEAVMRLFTLESTHVDRASADRIAALFRADSGNDRDRIYRGVRRTRTVAAHPLGVTLLDRMLGGLSLTERDLSWTEWLRGLHATLLEDLDRFESRWSAGAKLPDERDASAASWIAWLLTSTDRELRDRATRALFVFGRRMPRELFKLTLERLTLNDTYVPERLLAAGYGVAMAEIRNNLPAWREALGDFAESLHSRMLAEDAYEATTHYLMREYAARLCQLAHRAEPDLFSAEDTAHFSPPFIHPRPSWDALTDESDPHFDDGDAPLMMDFRNYTVGRLVRDRGNYQDDHPQYQRVLGEIRWRIHELGYRRELMGDADREIAHDHYSRTERPGRVERYGKKYAWIAFFEQAGRLIDAGALQRDEYYGGRLSDVDIDPSFPHAPPPAPIDLPAWARTTPAARNRWLTSGIVAVPDELLRREELEGHSGPWVALHGFLLDERADLDRRVFGFVRGLLLPPGRWADLAEGVRGTAYLANNRIPEEGSDYYTFAGEIPWCDTFARAWVAVDSDVPHLDIVELADGREIEVEIPVHRYSWESYHSVTNEAGGFPVPARAISTHLGLLGGDRRLDLFDQAGREASLVYRAPHGFRDSSELVYLREDLLLDYCTATGREFGWIVWGERELHHVAHGHVPDSVLRIYRANRNAHRRVVSLAALSGK